MQMLLLIALACAGANELDAHQRALILLDRAGAVGASAVVRGSGDGWAHVVDNALTLALSVPRG